MFELRSFVAMGSVLALLLVGCGQQSTLVLREAAPVDDTEQFVTYLNRVPACDFEVIAHLHSKGGFTSADGLVEDFRRQAKALGANALSVEYIQRTDVNQYIGNARALRCL
jgi:hypothetical protein